MPEWMARGLVRTLALAATLLLGSLLLGSVAAASAAPEVLPCAKQDPKTAPCRKVAKPRPATAAHPAIEAEGATPGTAGIMPLLRPGTFRLDLSSYFTSYPLFGLGNIRGGPTSSLLGSFTLGYGVSDRLTIFGGASESNIIHANGTFQGEFVDPQIGFVYRAAPQLWGNSVDVVGNLIANAPLSSPPASTAGPYGDLGPMARGLVLVTRELGHGFTLQVNGGFQAAIVTTTPFGSLPTRTAEVDAIFGVAGQYRVPQLSNRLYLNGELAVIRPLTNDTVQIYASPFRTADVYSATLGATYAIKPGFMLARVTDTVAYNVVNGNNLFPPPGGGPRHFVSNTVGLTISFVNLTPQNWLHGWTH